MAVNRKKSSTNENPEVSYSVQVKRAHEFDSGDIGFDMVVNGVSIYNCTYKSGTGKDGNDYAFVSFPSRKASDGNYYNFAYFKVSDEVLQDIETQIEKLL